VVRSRRNSHFMWYGEEASGGLCDQLLVPMVSASDRARPDSAGGSAGGPGAGVVLGCEACTVWSACGVVHLSGQAVSQPPPARLFTRVCRGEND
jgi:hypothetical protein